MLDECAHMEMIFAICRTFIADESTGFEDFLLVKNGLVMNGLVVEESSVIEVGEIQHFPMMEGGVVVGITGFQITWEEVAKNSVTSSKLKKVCDVCNNVVVKERVAAI